MPDLLDGRSKYRRVERLPDRGPTYREGWADNSVGKVIDSLPRNDLVNTS